MTVLWSNATYEDFNDPISFLKNQIEFLDNETLKELGTPRLDIDIPIKQNVK